MVHSSITGASRPSGRLILACLAIWALLALALPLSALTLNAFRVGEFPLGFWVAAQGSLLGLAGLGLLYAWRAGGAAPSEGLQPGLVFAAEAIGAVTLLGFTGYIAAMGYDGLALPLGLVAGLALLAILVAPRFVLYPVRSISGFFTVRYGGGASRRLALVITAVATVLLLAADLKAGAVALQGLARTQVSEAIAALAVMVGAIWLSGGLFARRKIAGLGFAFILLGLFATLIAIAVYSSGSPLPHITLGIALEQHANLNQALVVNRLSDVKSLTPMTSPFLQISMRNFAGLMLAVALGIVAAPHLLGRHVSQAAVAPGGAVRRTAMALVGVAVVALSLPPLAVYSRIGFESALSKGIENAAIPQSFADASALGWVKVCNQHSGQSTELAAACAKAAGQRGFLRLQDLAFTPDSFVVAAPQMSGFDIFVRYPLLIVAVLASVLVGNALVAGVIVADTEIRLNGPSTIKQLDFRALMLGASLVTAAGLVAAVDSISTGLLAAEGFALLAAGIFPALILGLHWRQMTAAGAVAAMLAGSLMTGAYLLGVHVWPIELFHLSGALSDAAPAAAKRFADLEAALAVATDPEAQAAARAMLVRQASTIANWGGLMPAAIVLLAVPLGFVTGILASLLSELPKMKQPVPAASRQ
jgi:cation/acetate symporter